MALFWKEKNSCLITQEIWWVWLHYFLLILLYHKSYLIKVGKTDVQHLYSMIYIVTPVYIPAKLWIFCTGNGAALSALLIISMLQPL